MKMKIESKKIMAMILAATLTVGGAYTGFIDTEKIGIDNAVVKAYAETYNNFDYTILADGTIEIVDFPYNIGGSVTIPSTINGINVTRIGKSAFYNCNFNEIIIPEGIIGIGELAFDLCRKLKSIKLPDSLEFISDGAFNSCDAITFLKIPKNVVKINGCPIASSNSNLTYIEVDKENKYYKDIEGVLYTKNGETLIKYPDNAPQTTYTIPKSTLTIGEYAFYYSKNLQKITVSNGVKNICDCIIGYTKLQEITLPLSVENISNRAFSYANNLLKIKIQKDTNSILGTPWKAPKAIVEWIGNPIPLSPTITVQPKGDSYTEGDNANPTFVNASVSDGGTISYQWFKGDGTTISGATSSTFIPPTNSVGTQNYYCIVTNTLGTKIATTKSDVVSINVVAKVDAKAPTITKQPQGGSYKVGDTAKPLQVIASTDDGGSLTYKWFKDGIAINGETKPILDIDTSTLGDSIYYCEVKNTLKNSTTTTKSDEITISVVNKKDISKDEGTQTEEPNTSEEETQTESEPSTSDGGTQTDEPNTSEEETQTESEPSTSDGGTQTDEPNTSEETKTNAKVPVITKDLDKSHIDTTVNKGSINLDIEAESQDDGVLSYQWLKDGNIIDGETKESLTIDTSQTGTHLYKCLVTNTLDVATGDKTDTISSKIVSITVEPKISEPGSNNSRHNRPSKPIDESTTEEKITEETDEIIEIILPNPDSDTTEVPGTEKDYIYGKDKDGNIFEVEHHYDRNKKVHIIKILSDYVIVKSNVPLDTNIENPMIELEKDVINTGAIDISNNFSFCSKFVNHFGLDGIKKSIKFYLTK